MEAYKEHNLRIPNKSKGDQIKRRRLLIGASVAIVVLVLIFRGGIEFTPDNLAADGVDLIPEINLDDCMSQIRATNPDMSEQDANDNCYTIEAVNQKDSSICSRVSDSFRPNCLGQFA